MKNIDKTKEKEYVEKVNDIVDTLMGGDRESLNKVLGALVVLASKNPDYASDILSIKELIYDHYERTNSLHKVNPSILEVFESKDKDKDGLMMVASDNPRDLYKALKMLSEVLPIPFFTALCTLFSELKEPYSIDNLKGLISILKKNAQTPKKNDKIPS